MKKCKSSIKEELPLLIIPIVFVGIVMLAMSQPNSAMSLVDNIGNKAVLGKDTLIIAGYEFPFAYKLSNGRTVDYKCVTVIKDKP